MNSDETNFWPCTGSRNNRHALVEVPQGKRCPICGKKPDEKKPFLPILTKIFLGFLVLLVSGGVFIKVKDRFANSSENPPEEASKEIFTKRFTKGEHSLFPEISNANRDNGIEALNYGNNDHALKFFEKAVIADRNDPEVLIFYNNALARQNVSSLTLAAVVPVDSKGNSAREMLRGIAMAQNEFNEELGVNGQLLEILIANDGNNPVNSEKVAQQLVNDRSILGVIGHNSSSASKAGLEIYKSKGLAMISPTSTSTDLKSKVFFRTVPSDEAAGKKLAQYIEEELQLEKVVIFNNPGSSYSNSLSDAFTKEFDGDIVEEIDISVKNPDPFIEQQLSSSILIGKAEAALLFPDTKYTSVAIEIAKANSKITTAPRLKLLGGDALYSSRTLLSGGKAVDDLVLVVPWIDKIPQSKAFQKFGHEQWGGSVNWRTAMSYDATKAFIAAFSANSNPTRSSILKDLARIQLSSNDTSGEEFQFTPEGEVRREPVLVKATRGAKARPQGSDFGFELVE